MGWRTIGVAMLLSTGCSPTAPPRAASPEVEEPTDPSQAVAREPVVETGELTVNVRNGWAEVWMDGERLTDETPLNAWGTTAGTHHVRVVQPETDQVLFEGRVEVRADVMTIVHIDASTRSHEIELFEE